MRTSIIFIAFALLAVSVFSQTTCEKGNDKPCTDLIKESCCAYMKATQGGSSVETYACALPSTFNSVKSTAKSAGGDVEIYCANAVFMKLSALALS